MSAAAKSLLAGTLILSASSIFVRLIGFIFRIYLSNTIGAQGMGLYSLIMSAYALGSTVAISGISLAVSKLAAEELGRGSRANARRILRRALSLSVAFGITVFALMFFFADFISVSILKDARCAFSLRLLAPGMPMLAVSACLRGYFIACRNMTNPAAGQIMEQFFKMAFIIILLGYWLPRGVEYGCAAVVAGITFGELVCFVYTIGGFIWERRRGYSRQKATLRGVTGKIMGIIVPVSLTSYARSALRLLEDVLILSGLRAFMGADDAATGEYGRVKGMVMPLLIFPLSMLSAFVVTLTPEISRLDAQGADEKLERTVSRILQITCVAGIFIVGIFMTFSREIGMAVYNDGEVGDMLRQMAFLCPFMCLEMVVVSILQGLGHQASTMRYSLCDCVLRVAMVFFLVPSYGINGFTLMVVVSNLFTSALNLRKLLKLTKIRLQINDWLIKPTLAAISSGQAVKAVCNFYLFDALSLWQSLALGFFVIAAVYVSVLFAVGSITPQDFKWLTNRFKIAGKAPANDPKTAYTNPA